MKKLYWLGLVLPLMSCGKRNEKWDEPAGSGQSVGLTGSVALVDENLNRALMLTSPAPYQLDSRAFPIGKDVAAIETSADRDTLFVLSRGVQPRRNPDDELPSITVIDAGPEPELVKRFELTDPKESLAVDPDEDWLVAFQGGATVTNPNEFVLLPLGQNADDVESVTIRSFGGVPRDVLFTDPLVVPNGPPRRFLIVHTDRDIALIDLSDLSREEVTIQTPETEAGTASTPAQVVFDPGVAGSDDDPGRFARIGVRLQNEPDVMLLELGVPTEGSNKDFEVKFNIINVGGIPSAIEFVNTDFGLRLAALVPTRSQATLIDPATTVIEAVSLPDRYTQLARVTEDAGDEGELALLYSPETEGIAFWALGRASGDLSKSVQQNEIQLRVAEVHDVPGENYAHLKILQGADSDRFFILDLKARQTFPMLTDSSGFIVNVAPDGERAWAFRPDGSEFASIEFSDLHPTSLSVALRVSEVWDIERSDGSRAALALHGTDGRFGAAPSVTLLDAEAPDSADTRFFGSLMLEGL